MTKSAAAKSSRNSKQDAVTKTVDSPQYDGRYDVIAEHAVSDGKRIASAGKRFSSLVDEIAHNVFLAYSTGYVHTERTSKDNPLPLGSIRQNEYVALFAPKSSDDDSKGPSVTTITRWRRCGAALAAGIDKSDPVYRALKSGNVAVDIAAVLDVADPDEAKIRKAYAAWVKTNDKAKAQAKALTATVADESDEQPETRAAQVSTHEAKSGEMIAVLADIVAGLDVESLTPDEYANLHAAYDVLGAKFEAYDKMAQSA